MLNVYDSGLFPNLVIGISRISTIVVFGLGLSFVTPRIYVDPVSPWWMVPLVALGSAVPMIVTYLASGSYVHHIHVVLPASARASKEDLMRFAANVPPASTQLYIKGMQFAPWPTTRSVFFEDLRRLRPGWMQIANLEHMRPAVREEERQYKNRLWGWLAKRMMGTHFVSRTQLRDRSRAPGVLDRMWEQIPMEGEPEEAIAKRMREKRSAGERRPVLMANRPARVASSSSPADRSRVPMGGRAKKR